MIHSAAVLRIPLLMLIMTLSSTHSPKKICKGLNLILVIFYITRIHPRFSESALTRQSILILGLGRLGREADLRVTGTNLLFGFFENLFQNLLLY